VHSLQSGKTNLVLLQRHVSVPSIIAQIFPSASHTALALGPQGGSTQSGYSMLESLHIH
jgi:hypothetical protein